MLHTVEQLLYRSLDHDLKVCAESRNISLELAMLVQTVRLLRGKSLPVIETAIEGWSADGKTWLPSEPGTFTPQIESPEQK